jgi:hypothetical protein
MPIYKKDNSMISQGNHRKRTQSHEALTLRYFGGWYLTPPQEWASDVLTGNAARE